jgi:low temperature requirement protein LtrA
VARFQRPRQDGVEQHATSIELFYDLVFVFAVTQVSHLLLHHLSWAGAAEAGLVLLMVWWAWNYTAWVTNELDPDSVAVRGLMITITLVTLVMAIAIPGAFGAHVVLFACSYVAIQVGRHLFLTFVSGTPGSVERERSLHILVWFVASGVFWVAGALVPSPARYVLWVVALAIDYSAPMFLYRVPGRPRLAHDTWDVESAHFAERFQLFVIIAIGESIVVTGATTSDLALTATRVSALAVAFLASAAFWWLYFDFVARIAQRRLELTNVADRTKLARDGYTYLHVFMVAGIIVAAVGDGLVIARPTGHPPADQVIAIVAGPALYLLAHTAFRLRLAGSISTKRLTGAVACMLLGLVGTTMPSLLLLVLLLVVLVAVIASEVLSAHRRRIRGEPSPLERLETTVS